MGAWQNLARGFAKLRFLGRRGLDALAERFAPSTLPFALAGTFLNVYDMAVNCMRFPRKTGDLFAIFRDIEIDKPNALLKSKRCNGRKRKV